MTKCPVCNAEANCVLENNHGCEHCTRDCALEEVTALLWKSQRALVESREATRWQREHAEALDNNWSRMHDAAISAFRYALDMPEATIPEMTKAIERMRARLQT